MYGSKLVKPGMGIGTGIISTSITGAMTYLYVAVALTLIACGLMALRAAMVRRNSQEECGVLVSANASTGGKHFSKTRHF